MKIHKLETFCNEFVGFVRVTTDTGDQGWGQVSTYNSDITCEIFHRQVARHALGTDALDFADTLRPHQRARTQVPGVLPAPRHHRARHGTAGTFAASWRASR